MILKQIFGDIYKNESQKSNFDLCKQMILFKGINDSGIKQIIKYFHVRHYKKDEYVFQEKTSLVRVYIS